MTVKKALELLNYYSEKKVEIKNGFLDRNKSWNHGEISLYPLSQAISQMIESDLIFLEGIKKQIKPNCLHPKEFQDIDPDGNLYCMDCNLDL